MARVCRRLDGLPLAIEFAAARVRVLAPAQVARLLDDRFRLLTGGSRAALPRQQTLRATLDWSYALLAEPERALLRRLGVFAGGWTLEAAEAVGAGRAAADAEVEAWAVLDLLTQLADKSLVQAEVGAGGARYHLLETVRSYARDRLQETGEEAAVRDRHLAWCVALVPAGDSFGHKPLAAQALILAEQDNLRGALEWGLDADPGAGLGLAASLANPWRRLGRHEEASRWLERFLARVPPVPAAAGDAAESTRPRALYWLGRLAQELGETERARAPLAESLALFRAAGDDAGTGLALESLGLVARTDGRPAAARRCFEAALAAYARAGRIDLAADAQRSLGALWLALGDLQRAEATLSQSVTLAPHDRAGRRSRIGPPRCHRPA